MTAERNKQDVSDKTEAEVALAVRALAKSIEDIAQLSSRAGSENTVLAGIDRHLEAMQEEVKSIFTTLHVVRPDGGKGVIPTIDSIDMRAERTEKDMASIKKMSMGILAFMFAGFASWIWTLFTHSMHFMPGPGAP